MLTLLAPIVRPGPVTLVTLLVPVVFAKETRLQLLALSVVSAVSPVMLAPVTRFLERCQRPQCGQVGSSRQCGVVADVKGSEACQ